MNQPEIERLAEETWNQYSVSIPEDCYSLEEYTDRIAGKEIMYKDDFINAIAGYTAAKEDNGGDDSNWNMEHLLSWYNGKSDDYREQTLLKDAVVDFKKRFKISGE